ncbi:SDR family NAD(P)-dependent oxidoreductase [Propionibacterium australiense]|uniref:SDR family oxidoreductase n=1 Tax=Propionibacterium australiense TaxID=119981 RepID=A0A383S835_9ACTN|nr:SDR family oxidoreductase [Propionibacterium australiense]RLP09667.1 SDR family oxidoreductase [Propionibacterium australiense]RLP12369.1 SDR family oxidoreductase [Propionibacterium australiense]SYZ33574.1 Short-chain dehydrogenase/reductase SDR [Propionibacterium australiense]VEH89544.1 Pyridoxal 4-dehydrogenase [Propionibacterium australiense]
MDALERFAGKTVVITGAGGNIGSGISRRFSAEGANVVLLGRRRDRLDGLVAELGERHTLALTADVTVRDDLVTAMDAAAGRFGGIDVLVANAGTNIPRPFEELTEDDWHHLMDVNAGSAFTTAQTALPYLKESRGSIVTIAATNGLGGDRKGSAFNAAKGAVVNFTRGLAYELGEFGIRVNAVAPALTVSDEFAQTPPVSEWVRLSEYRQALTGHGRPEDVAAAVAFLASADARFITGAILPVDGGISAASGLPEFF